MRLPTLYGQLSGLGGLDLDRFMHLGAQVVCPLLSTENRWRRDVGQLEVVGSVHAAVVFRN